ncbi:hypothetical protein BZM26_34290 [Paraburkholderia strydomiana]|nr:hypothetical protein BZM26_34290 [Paraburkholderia strydomiana]
MTETEWIKLRIAEVVDEAPDIRSFLLQAENGTLLPAYGPAQYLPIRVLVPGEAKPLSRTYTLSDVYDDRRYRISVERRHSIALASSAHDARSRDPCIGPAKHLHLRWVQPETGRPAVRWHRHYSHDRMLRAALLRSRDAIAPLYFIHDARSGSDRPFRAFLRAAAAQYAHLSVHPMNTADTGAGGGHISVTWLRSVLPLDN